MTLRGVGIDVAGVRRFARLVEAYGDRFIARWFTECEVRACVATPDTARALAARFAAKEAVWKSLGVVDWDGPLPWRSIEICCAHRPAARLTGAVAHAASRVGVTSIWLGMDSNDEFAIAWAVTNSIAVADRAGDR